jgi:hypothetical protein
LPFSGPGFHVPVEVLPTPTENIVLNGYFSKTTILIAILPCNLAGFYGHLFLAKVSVEKVRKRLPDAPL